MPGIVLVHPEIPPNTGNISRTCVATRTPLYLVGKLGFSLHDRYLRRAGLDYWVDLQFDYRETLEELRQVRPEARLVLTSVRGDVTYDKFDYSPEDLIVFGSESLGLGQELIRATDSPTIRVPTWGPVRSLNLSNAVAIVLYEAYRQLGTFPG